jgi:hypothetical protein
MHMRATRTEGKFQGSIRQHTRSVPVPQVRAVRCVDRQEAEWLMQE